MVKMKSSLLSQSFMERSTLEGDSPVDKNRKTILQKSSTSSIGSVNMAELTANPKYYSKSDSKLSTARES